MARSAKVGARRRTQSYVERRDPKRDKTRRKKRPPRAQLSKSGAGIFAKPAETQPGYVRPDKIFLHFILSVKATTRHDNQA